MAVKRYVPADGHFRRFRLLPDTTTANDIIRIGYKLTTWSTVDYASVTSHNQLQTML